MTLDMLTQLVVVLSVSFFAPFAGAWAGVAFAHRVVRTRQGSAAGHQL